MRFFNQGNNVNGLPIQGIPVQGHPMAPQQTPMFYSLEGLAKGYNQQSIEKNEVLRVAVNVMIDAIKAYEKYKRDAKFFARAFGVDQLEEPEQGLLTLLQTVPPDGPLAIPTKAKYEEFVTTLKQFRLELDNMRKECIEVPAGSGLAQYMGWNEPGGKTVCKSTLLIAIDNALVASKVGIISFSDFINRLEKMETVYKAPPATGFWNDLSRSAKGLGKIAGGLAAVFIARKLLK